VLLDQRLAKAAQQASQGNVEAFKQLRESREEFASLMKLLAEGGQAGGTTLPATSAAARPALDALDKEWKKTEKNAALVINEQANLVALGNAVRSINASNPTLLELADALGKDGVGVAISQVVPFPWATGVPVVKEYQALAKKAGFADYNFSAMEGFLVAKVMVEGLRRSGKNLTREGFVDTMEKMQDVDVGGFFVSYSPQSHTGSKFVDLTIIGRDGKFLR